MVGMVQSMSSRLKSPASMMILLQLLAKRDSDRCSWSKISAPVLGAGRYNAPMVRLFCCSSEIVHHSSSAFTSNVGSVDDVSVFRIAMKTPPPLLSRRSFLCTL